MSPILCSLHGPFAINFYGLWIAVGIIVGLWHALRNPLVIASIPRSHIIPLINYSIFSGIVGGRVLHIITEWNSYQTWFDLIAVWDGGLAILGGLIGIAIAITLYARYHQIPLLPILDCAALYAPLVQGFGRIGCFFAGCCHGTACTLPWAITYTHPLSYAPLCIALHPTQLYNAAALFTLFFILLKNTHRLAIPGELATVGFFGLTAIRFALDFWRGDRGDLIPFLGLELSAHQLIGLAIMVTMVLAYGIIRMRARP